jgi:DNA repair protein RadC
MYVIAIRDEDQELLAEQEIKIMAFSHQALEICIKLNVEHEIIEVEELISGDLERAESPFNSP